MVTSWGKNGVNGNLGEIILSSQQRKQEGKKQEEKAGPSKLDPMTPGPSTSIHDARINLFKLCLHCALLLLKAFNSKQNLYHFKNDDKNTW